MIAPTSAAGTPETAENMAGREVAAARRELVGEKLTSTLNKVNGAVEPNASVESEAQKNERMNSHLRTLKVGMKYFSEKHGACEVIGIEGDRIRMRIQDYKTPRGGAILGEVHLRSLGLDGLHSRREKHAPLVCRVAACALARVTCALMIYPDT